jgi:hypothetical protein
MINHSPYVCQQKNIIQIVNKLSLKYTTAAFEAKKHLRKVDPHGGAQFYMNLMVLIS